MSTGIAALDSRIDQTASNVRTLGQSNAEVYGGGASYNPATGQLTAPTYVTRNGDGTTATAHNVGDALSNLYNGGVKYQHTNSTSGDSLATGQDATAIGAQALASGDSALAVGAGAKATGTKDATAIGTQALASGDSAVALGSHAQATGTNAVAIGTGALATGSQAIGNNARAGGGGTAIGDGADAGGTPLSVSTNISRGTAVGYGAVVQQSGGVALGTGSVAATPSGIVGYASTMSDASNRQSVQATTSTLAAVSVGDAANGQYRQVTGVAAGTADTDAVNVSQLRATDNSVSRLNTRLNEVQRSAYSGTAMAFALSGSYLPPLAGGEQAVGLGVGNYKGYSAIAVNYKAVAKDGRMSWGAGLTTTGKEWGVAAGIGWKW